MEEVAVREEALGLVDRQVGGHSSDLVITITEELMRWVVSARKGKLGPWAICSPLS